MKWRISKKYRYACSCGCDSIMITARLAVAEGSAHPGSIEEVWEIGNTRKVVADTYSLEDARRVVGALNGVLT